MNNKFKVLFKDTIIFALGSFGSKVILFLPRTLIHELLNHRRVWYC